MNENTFGPQAMASKEKGNNNNKAFTMKARPSNEGQDLLNGKRPGPGIHQKMALSLYKVKSLTQVSEFMNLLKHCRKCYHRP